MRSNRSLLLAGLAALVTVTFLALGCSDDDSTATPPVTPDPDDNTFETMLGVVQGQVSQYLDSAIATMESGLEVAKFVNPDVVRPGDIGDLFMGSGFPDSTVDGDWIVSYLTDISSGVGTKTVVDSITYVANGHYSNSARDAESMFARHKFQYLNQDTTVTSTDIIHHGNLDITGIDGFTATINGFFTATVRDKFVSTDSTTTGGAWTSGCPNSGTCTVNVIWQHAVDDELPTYTQWQLDVTFTDGVIVVDVATGNLTASYEDTVCTL
jgi:hypothetical protein